MGKILAILATLMLLPPAAFSAEPEIDKGSVVVIPLKGAVSEAQFFFLRRILKQVESREASAIIIDMNTPGGSLKATEDIVQMLMKSKVPTYTYVNTNAASAGALVAIGTKRIYMAPISAIGAAAPVSGGGEDLQETMNAKVVSYYSAYFRSVAEKNGYFPGLVDGFMNMDKEIKIGDHIVNPKGELLTLSAQEATKMYDNKPLLAAGVADSLDDLCAKAGLDAKKIVRLEPSGFERVAQWITMLAPIFLLAGMLGAWIEFKSPGFGIAGVLSIICFLLFFAGHYIAGLTGFEVMAVFALGLLLVLVELIFFPGVMFLAALGTAMMVGSLLFAMVDFYPSQPFVFSPDIFVRPLTNLSIALVLFLLAAMLLARFFPELPFFNRLVLAAQVPTGTSVPGEVCITRLKPGDEGRAKTILRPAGKAEFGGELFDVVTDGEFLEAGARIRVAAVYGDRVVVAAV